MRCDNNYVLIPILSFVVVIAGSYITSVGMIDSEFISFWFGLIMLCMGVFLWVECLGERIRDDIVDELYEEDDTKET